MELRTWSLFLSTVGFYLVHDATGQSASGNGSEFVFSYNEIRTGSCLVIIICGDVESFNLIHQHEGVHDHHTTLFYDSI